MMTAACSNYPDSPFEDDDHVNPYTPRLGIGGRTSKVTFTNTHCNILVFGATHDSSQEALHKVIDLMP